MMKFDAKHYLVKDKYKSIVELSRFNFGLSFKTSHCLMPVLASVAISSSAIETASASKRMIPTSAQTSPYAVNMQDGGLIIKEDTSFQLQGGLQLNLERVYRSRSFQKGFFGQGWCSSLESEIDFQGKGIIHLKDCNSSKPRIFSLNAGGFSYVNLENPKDELRIRLGFYDRVINGETKAKYNAKGQLTNIQISNLNWRIQYDERRLPRHLIYNDLVTLKLNWHPILSLVESLEVNSRRHFKFEYRELSLVRSDNGIQFLRYEYDDLDNLILRRTPRSTISFHYDKNADRISKIQSECEEIYEFPKISPSYVKSNFQKKCIGKPIQISNFTFEYNLKTRMPAHVEFEQNPKPTKPRLSAVSSTY